ncbi:hypothetical protein V6N12_075979 [Hibiscus sabdariffa]|uniref:Uncharacterized protein n=1 Tax=Hibiscus sabdariffa TaxID=183260 RepID=A0ABR2AY16_9ROSI
MAIVCPQRYNSSFAPHQTTHHVGIMHSSSKRYSQPTAGPSTPFIRGTTEGHIGPAILAIQIPSFPIPSENIRSWISASSGTSSIYVIIRGPLDRERSAEAIGIFSKPRTADTASSLSLWSSSLRPSPVGRVTTSTSPSTGTYIYLRTPLPFVPAANTLPPSTAAGDQRCFSKLKALSDIPTAPGNEAAKSYSPGSYSPGVADVVELRGQLKERRIKTPFSGFTYRIWPLNESSITIAPGSSTGLIHLPGNEAKYATYESGNEVALGGPESGDVVSFLGCDGLFEGMKWARTNVRGAKKDVVMEGKLEESSNWANSGIASLRLRQRRAQSAFNSTPRGRTAAWVLLRKSPYAGPSSKVTPSLGLDRDPLPRVGASPQQLGFSPALGLAWFYQLWSLPPVLSVSISSTDQITGSLYVCADELYLPDKRLLKPDFRNGSNQLISVLQLSCSIAPRTVLNSLDTSP